MAYLPGSDCTTNNLQCLFHQGTRVFEGAIGLLITFATLAFIYNVIRYFIIESDNEAGRETARRYMLWSILGIVVILSIWGIFSILTAIFGVSAGGGHLLNDYSHLNGFGGSP